MQQKNRREKSETLTNTNYCKNFVLSSDYTQTPKYLVIRIFKQIFETGTSQQLFNNQQNKHSKKIAQITIVQMSFKMFLE